MIQNINKPTSPFWNKVQLICVTLSVFIAGYGQWGAHSSTITAIGGALGALGTIIPILIPPKE